MISGVKKKYSGLIIALAVVLSAALFAFGWVQPASAEFNPVTGFEYIEGGTAAYRAAEDSQWDNKEELKASLQNVSSLSVAYATALKAGNAELVAGTASTEAALELLESYNAAMDAIAEYNAAARESYSVSLKAKFAYREGAADPVEISSDITAAVADICYKNLTSTVANWEGAAQFEYAHKYAVNYAEQGQEVTLFEVYANFNGDPLINAVSADAELIVNEGKNNVVDMTFTYAGNEYKAQISLSRRSTGKDPVTLKDTYEYSVKVISQSSVGQDGALTEISALTAVLDEEYAALAAKIDVNIIAGAKKAFKEEPDRSTMEATYNEYVSALNSKIAAVRTVGEEKANALISGVEPELYTADDYSAMQAAVAECIESVKASASIAAMNEAIAAAQQTVASVKSIPASFRDTYADVLAVNTVYTAEQRTLALEAYEAVEAYSQAAQDALADEKELLISNVRQTAIYNIDKNADEAVEGKTLSHNQKLQIVNEREKAKNAVNTTESATQMQAACDAFDEYLAGINFTTVNSLESGLVKVEAVMDSLAQLNATAAAIGDTDTETLDTSKKQIKLTRRLSALEIYDINLSVAGTPIDYAGETVYRVTVQLSKDTLELFKTGGIEPKSLIIAYVDENGGIETYPTTLTFKYEDGSQVVYDGPASVDWDKIAEGSFIMFETQHFSSYYLMGNTSNLGSARLGNLLAGLAGAEGIVPIILIAVGALVGVLLLFVLISFIVSVCKRYKICFVPNGGTKVKKIRKKYGKKLPELPVPTKEGYVFTGWYIDAGLKYEFNRKVMPRANTVLYAGWAEEGEAPVEDNLSRGILNFYDHVRAKLASYTMPVKAGEKSFVEQEVLAKMYVEDGAIKIYIKNKRQSLIDDYGKTYILAEDDKFESGVITDELSYNNAITAIERMAGIFELVEGKAPELPASTEEEAKMGYAYTVKYQEVASFDERYCAIRSYAMSYAITDPEKAQEGKLLFELIPNEKSTLDLALAFNNPDGYNAVLDTKKTIGQLDKVFTVCTGEDMYVALELVDRIMKENGFAEQSEQELLTFFDPSEAYQYYIVLEEVPEEPTEEPVAALPVAVEESEQPAEPVALEELFAQYRSYVSSFAMFAAEGSDVDRSNDGLLIIKAKLCEEDIVTTLDPMADAEAFNFATEEGLEEAKAKVDALMAKYGLEYGASAEVEESEESYFGYRIKFPAVKTLEQMLGELRDYTNAYALFAAEGEEPDQALNGKVIVKAGLQDEDILVQVDPDGELQTLNVKTEEELEEAKQAIGAAMAKYGLEVDDEYAPAEKADGKAFGFRVKF